MSIPNEKSAPKWIIAITILSLTLMAIGSFYYAGKETMQLIADINKLPKTIAFDKGAFYMWGAGFLMFIMAAGASYINYLKRAISSQADKKITKILIASVVIMFALPQAVHHATENYLEDYDYVICTGLSTQWLHARTIVYSRVLPCISKEEYRRRFIEGE